MMIAEELGNRREINTQETKQVQEQPKETRQTQNNTPEVLTNPIYTPGFLRTQIGKLMRIEFLIGTNNMVDRVGFLEEVGTSYILLRSFEGDTMIYADLYAIKFITISIGYNNMQNFQNMNNIGMQNMNWNMNRYY